MVARDKAAASPPEALDPRQLATRAALRQAIVELATSQPVRTISMSELARAAGVHRTTLYNHTESPADLIGAVFKEDLDSLRRSHLEGLGDANLGSAMRAVALGVLEHLEQHASIYARELSDPANQLHALLRDHFATSARTLLEEHRLGPKGRDKLPKALFREMAARWIADATVGAMTAWLEQPEPRDRELYLRVQATLLPPWWPGASAP